MIESKQYVNIVSEFISKNTYGQNSVPISWAELGEPPQKSPFVDTNAVYWHFSANMILRHAERCISQQIKLFILYEHRYL